MPVKILQPTGGIWGIPLPVFFSLTNAVESETYTVEIKFSVDGGQTFHLVTERQNSGSGGLVNLSSGVAGVRHFFVWDVMTDIPGTHSQPKQNVLLKIKATSLNDTIETTSDAFTLDGGFNGLPENNFRAGGTVTPPVIYVFDPKDHEGIQVVARFLVKQSENARVNVRAEFKVKDQEFQPATPALNSDQLTNLPAPNINADYRFLWDAASDLQKIGIDTAEITLRFTPYIGLIEGNSYVTKPFNFKTKRPSPLTLPSPKIPLDTLRIIKISGDNQDIVAGLLANQNLRVEVRDANNQVVQGARLTFSVGLNSVNLAFEDDPDLRTTTDYFGRAGIRVRSEAAAAGDAVVMVHVVGVPGVSATFHLTSRIARLIPQPSNPTGPLKYGNTYSFSFRFDSGIEPSVTDFYTDEFDPVEFSITAHNAEASANVVRLNDQRFINYGNYFEIKFTPSVLGPALSMGGSIVREKCSLKIEAMNLKGTAAYEAEFEVETDVNETHLQGINVLNNGFGPEEDIEKKLRLYLDVVSGFHPGNPNEKIPQRIFPGLTLSTPFKVKVTDGVDEYTESIINGYRGTNIGTNCNIVLQKQPLKIKWTARNGMIATTMAIGNTSTLNAAADEEIYFTPTAEGPWSLEASFSGYVYDKNSRERIYHIKYHTGSSSSSTIASQPYCTLKPGLSVILSRTFFIHQPSAFGFEDIRLAAGGQPGPLLKQVKPGTKVRVLVKDLSPFHGAADEFELKAVRKNGEDIPLYTGTGLVFKRSVPLRLFQHDQTVNLRSDEILILQNENRISTGIPLAVIPLAWVTGTIKHLKFAVRTAGLKRQRLRFGAASLQGDTEFSYESPVGTSPAGGGLNSVTIHNGEFVYGGCDLEFPSRSGNISICRTYRSQVCSLLDPLTEQEVAEPFGRGWYFSAQRYLEVHHKHLRFWDGRGMYFDYTSDYPGKGQFLFITRNNAITAVQSAFEIRDRNRNVYHFNPDGSFRFLRDSLGNKYEHDYNEKGQLTKIKDCLLPDTRAFSIKYYEDNEANRKNLIANQIEEISDFAGRKTNYEYYSQPVPGDQQKGGAGCLKKITFPKCVSYFETGTPPDANHRSFEIYEYEEDARLGWRLTRIQTLDSKKIIKELVSNVYLNGRVTSQKYVNEEFRFIQLSANELEVVDRNQFSTKFTFPSSPFWDGTAPEKVIDPEGFVSFMKHNQDGHATLLQPPAGGKVENIYDEDSQFARSRADLIAEIHTSSEGNQRVCRYDYESRFHHIITSVGFEGNMAGADPELHKFHFNYDHQRNNGDAGNVVDSFGPRTLNMVYKPLPDGTRQPEWIEETPTNHYSYNRYGLITSHINPAGIKTEYLYYPESSPTTGIPSLNGGGFLAELRYDTQRNSKRDIHLPGIDNPPQNKVIKYKYNTIGYITEREEDGIITSITPNELGEPVRTEFGRDTDGLNITEETGLGPNGEILTISSAQPSSGGDAQKIERKFSYNSKGVLESSTIVVNGQREVKQMFRFDKGDRLEESSNDLNGIQTTFIYDKRGLAKETIINDGINSLKTTRSFDDNGGLLEITHPTNDKTVFLLNSFQEIVGVKYPTGITAESILNHSGIPVVTVHRNKAGNIHSISETVWDEYLRPRRTHDLLFDQSVPSNPTERKTSKIPENLGLTGIAAYLPSGNQALQNTGFGQNDSRRTTDAVYNLSGHLARATDDSLSQQYIRTDGVGRIIESEDRRNNRTIVSFDQNRREIKISYPASSDDPLHPGTCTFALKASLDVAGRIVQVSNNLGHTFHCKYDTAGKLTELTDPMGEPSTETYDGLPSSPLINKPGNLVTFRYDDFGRIKGSETEISVLDPESGSNRTTEFNEFNPANKMQIQLSYDELGRLAAKTDSKGNQFRFVYEHNFLKEILSPPDTSGQASSFAFGYDNSGRLETITDAKGNVVRKVYTNATLDTISVNGSNEGLKINYDEDGTITSLSELKDPSVKTAYVYDSLGNSREESVSFKVSNVLKTFVTKNEHDGVGRVTKRTLPEGDILEFIRNEGSNLLSEIRYRSVSLAKLYYMGDALLKRKTVKGVNTVFNYSSAGQLEQKIFNGAGLNEIITDYKYDRLHRVIEEKTTISGEVIQRKYTYDSVGRLVEERKTLPGNPAPLYSKYFYDADCVLRKETRDEIDPATGTVITRTILRETDEQGRVNRVNESVSLPVSINP